MPVAQTTRQDVNSVFDCQRDHQTLGPDIDAMKFFERLFSDHFPTIDQLSRLCIDWRIPNSHYHAVITVSNNVCLFTSSHSNAGE